MAETRRRLRQGDPRAGGGAGRDGPRRAARVRRGHCSSRPARSRCWPGRCSFFRVFGPGLAVAALVVTLVCVTLVPALMGALGPWLFGSRVPRAAARERPTPELGERAAGAAARRRAPADRAPGRRPRRWSSPALGAARRSPRSARGRRRCPSRSSRPCRRTASRGSAADDAAAGLRARHPRAHRAPARAAGHRRRADGAGRGCRRSLARQPGVAAVIGPAQAGGDAPLGRRRLAGRQRRRATRSCSTTSRPARTRSRRSAACERRMPRCRGRPACRPTSRASYAGETALAAGDGRRARRATCGASSSPPPSLTFVLLALFLRAVVAPLLLLAGSVLAFAGSFGLTAAAAPRRARARTTSSTTSRSSRR